MAIRWRLRLHIVFYVQRRHNQIVGMAVSGMVSVIQKDNIVHPRTKLEEHSRFRLMGIGTAYTEDYHQSDQKPPLVQMDRDLFLGFIV